MSDVDMTVDRTEKEGVPADPEDLQIDVVPQLSGERFTIAKYGAGSVFDIKGIKTLGDRPRGTAHDALLDDRIRLGADAARAIAKGVKELPLDGFKVRVYTSSAPASERRNLQFEMALRKRKHPLQFKLKPRPKNAAVRGGKGQYAIGQRNIRVRSAARGDVIRVRLSSR
jgi:hypothetical protein